MTLKVTVPNTSSDSLTFGSANTPTAAQVIGIDSGSSNGQLAFNTTASGTSTEAMRITAAQNVGIGTTSPSYKLDVNGSIRGDTFVRSTSGTVSSYLVANNGGGFGVVGTASNHPILFNTNDTERARIDTSGNLLVGATSQVDGEKFLSYSTSNQSSAVFTNNAATGAYTIQVRNYATSGDRRLIRFMQGSTPSDCGAIYYNGSSTVYATSSDYRLKENIVDLSGALSTVLQLKPRSYTWKDGQIDDTGFIAHELQEVFPKAVSGEKDAVDADGNPVYQGIDTSFLVATLTAAIQEQQAIIEQLTNRITALEAK